MLTAEMGSCGKQQAVASTQEVRESHCESVAVILCGSRVSSSSLRASSKMSANESSSTIQICSCCEKMPTTARLY